jgi:hypothetical protein
LNLRAATNYDFRLTKMGVDGTRRCSELADCINCRRKTLQHALSRNLNDFVQPAGASEVRLLIQQDRQHPVVPKPAIWPALVDELPCLVHLLCVVRDRLFLDEPLVGGGDRQCVLYLVKIRPRLTRVEWLLER